MKDMSIISFLANLGFTSQDYLLVFFCPIFSAIGSIVHAMLLEMDPNNMPSKGGVRDSMHAIAVLKWFFYRVFIGAIIGLILGLYFVGSLTESPNAIARIFALAVLLGYSAPKLWQLQEKHVLEQVEKKIEDALGSKDSGK